MPKNLLVTQSSESAANVSTHLGRGHLVLAGGWQQILWDAFSIVTNTYMSSCSLFAMEEKPQ